MGIVFSLLAAFFVSFRAAFEKKALKEMDEFTVAFGFRLFSFSFIFIALIVLSFSSITYSFQGEVFWKALIIGGILNTISSLLAMRALKLGELSLVGPMATFSPLFLLATSPLIIGEFPSQQGLAGVLLIVLGAYILNIKERANGYGEPILSLFNKDKGSLYMLGAAFVWSIGANIDKIGVTASSPLVWAGSVNLLVAIILLPVILKKKSFKKNEAKKINFLLLGSIGFAAALVATFQLYAISMILVVYVISLKRLSAVFEVFIGHFAFKEKSFGERLAGSFIMVLGATLIILS